MPIVIPREIPAFDILTRENVFVMPAARARTQDIRPIEIAVVNLMPTKIETETQLIRLLANTPLQVNLTLVRTASYRATHTPDDHLARFYVTFDQVRHRAFDGMIITGAPVETLAFDEVSYWQELKQILDFAQERVTSTICICWGAQAALNYYYGIQKHTLPGKLFGVFKNRAMVAYDPLLKGLNDTFSIPHSRYTTVDEEALARHPDLQVLAAGEECGVSIVKSRDNRRFFFFGHSEYDRDTLKKEYLRDREKGLDTPPPAHYFIDGDPERIDMSWNSTGNLLFYNWLNHYVYQVTPYSWEQHEG